MWLHYSPQVDEADQVASHNNNNRKEMYKYKKELKERKKKSVTDSGRKKRGSEAS